MKCPYSKNELILEAIKLESKFTDGNADKILKMVISLDKKFTDDRAVLNKKVSKYHGISVESLCSSQNYDRLIEIFKDSLMEQFRNDLKKELELKEKESWAIIWVCYESLKEGK